MKNRRTLAIRILLLRPTLNSEAGPRHLGVRSRVEWFAWVSIEEALKKR